MLATQKCIFEVLGKKKCIFLHGVFVRSTMCYQCDNVLSAHTRAPAAHSQGQVRVSLVSVNEVYFWSAWRRFEKLSRHLNCCHCRTRIRCTFTSFSAALVVSIGGLAWKLNFHSIISWCILIAAITEYEYVDFYLFFFSYYYFYQQWSRGKRRKKTRHEHFGGTTDKIYVTKTSCGDVAWHVT